MVDLWSSRWLPRSARLRSGSLRRLRWSGAGPGPRTPGPDPNADRDGLAEIGGGGGRAGRREVGGQHGESLRKWVRPGFGGGQVSQVWLIPRGIWIPRSLICPSSPVSLDSPLRALEQVFPQRHMARDTQCDWRPGALNSRSRSFPLRTALGQGRRSGSSSSAKWSEWSGKNPKSKCT